MEVDWDLHAVVRACCSTTTTSTTTTTTAPPLAWPTDTYTQQNINFYNKNLTTCFPDPFQTTNDNSIEHFLNNLYHPLQFQNLHKPPQSPQSLPISPLSVIGGLQDPPPNQYTYQQHELKQQFQGKQQSFASSRCTTSNAQSTRSKKRKNQMKKVCQMPAEGLSSDVWSWRKYGQKPIKGSPYPRSYYRCSTSKGCLARKQVERNRSDPDMFIVTYTGDHSHPVPTHRNSLAGSTRNKPISSPPVSPPTSNSPPTEKTEDNDNDNDNDTDDENFDMVMEDDFFDGLDELVGSATSCISAAISTAPPSFA